MSASKILVVDDSRSIRTAVKRILTVAGYDVICAADGNEAISRLEQNPNLMVLDIKMPGLDGYGVCEQLDAAGTDTKKLPVVFLTSNHSHAMELLGRQYGAYLHKPVEPEELLRVVADQLAAAESVASN